MLRPTEDSVVIYPTVRKLSNTSLGITLPLDLCERKNIKEGDALVVFIMKEEKR